MRYRLPPEPSTTLGTFVVMPDNFHACVASECLPPIVRLFNPDAPNSKPQKVSLKRVVCVVPDFELTRRVEKERNIDAFLSVRCLHGLLCV